MLRQSPRSHKSKGLKVKHVLQITVLIGVCVWLLYQVEHTHEKRNDLYESGGRRSEKIEETGHKIFRLGRKDIGSEIHMVTDKQSEDREEEEEDEEVKHQENDGDKRDSGEEEIEQHDQDKADDDTDQEDFVDGEEETQSESGKETESGDRGSLETQGHEHGDTGFHEVESVSNGLIHGTQLIGSDQEKENEEHVKNSNEPKENSETTSETTTEDAAPEGSGSKGNNSEVKVAPGEVELETVNDASHNVTTSEDGVRLSEVPDESRQNLTVSDFNDQTESHNNSASENGETPVSVLHNDRNVILSESQDQNTTITESLDQNTTSSELQEHEASLPEFQDQNRTLTESHDQNIIPSELQDLNTTSTELENRNTTVTGWQGQHTALSDSQDQNTTSSNEQKENADSVPERSDTDEHSEPGVVNEAVHTDGESSSNSLATQEERDALTDLDTLPQQDSDDTEAKAVAAE